MWPRLRARRAPWPAQGPTGRRSRHPGQALVAAGAAGLAAAAVLGITPVSSGSTATRGAPAALDVDFTGLQPGETRLVSSAEPPPDEVGQPVFGTLIAGAPTVSGDGRFVAQRAYNDQGEGGSSLSRIYLQQVAGGPRTLHGDPAYDNTAPTLSGDGSVMAYQTQRGGGYQTTGIRADIDVFVERGDDGSSVEQVTGTTSDLSYQRQLGCDPIETGEAEDWFRTSPCGPRLSTDGRTLAVETYLDPVPFDLQTTVEGEPEGSEFTGNVQLVDFGDGFSSRTVQVTNVGELPVEMSQPVAQGTGFTIGEQPTGPQFCDDGVILTPGTEGASCSITVSFARTSSCATRVGSLLIESPTPRGRSVLSLVGDDYYGCFVTEGPAQVTSDDGVSAQIANPGCPIPSLEATGPPDQELVDNGSGIQLSNFDTRPVGSAVLRTVEVLNPGSAAQLSFVAEGCGVVMLGPGDRPDLVDACSPDQVLEEEETCTAYIAFTPQAARGYVGSLQVKEFESSFARRFTFWGGAEQYGIVVRRDADGDGLFTGVNDPPARLANVGPTGRTVDALGFSLAGGGRYLAFSSTLNGRLDRARLFRHDLEAAEDGTPGETVEVPLGTPDIGTLLSGVGQPSISADGNRIAFLRDPDSGFTQIEVADLSQGRALLVSTPGDAVPGDYYSYYPSMSADGSTVAFVSWADLGALPAEAGGGHVYVRDLAPDFEGTGPPGNEVVSLSTLPGATTGFGTQPALNGDGAVVTFVSDSQIVEGAEGGVAQVYARLRYADPQVSPTSVEFPAAKVDVASDGRQISLTNLGPGPYLVEEAVTGPFRVETSCQDVVVHRGETCVVTVVMLAGTAGAQTGSLVLTLSSVAWPGVQIEVTLSGTALPNAQLRLTPDATSFTEQLVGVPSKPVTMTATNIGSLPMSLVVRTVPVVPTDDPDAVPPEQETEFLVLPAGQRPDTLVPELPDEPDPDRNADGDKDDEEGAPGSGTPGGDGDPDDPADPNGPNDPNDPNDPGDPNDPVVPGVPGVPDVLPPPPPEPETLPACAVLPPGGSCSFRVYWRPAQLAPRAANVEVVGTVDSVDYVKQAALTGLVGSPSVEYSPSVVRDGMVVFVKGAGFLPGQPLRLTWDTGIVAGPIVIPDDDGTFEAPLVMLKGRGPGLRQLMISMPGVPGSTIEAPPLLVVPGTSQPPDWGIRN